MNPYEKELLEKTYALSKENNSMLKKIRSASRWSIFFRVMYWVLIAVVAIVAFMFIKPYVDAVFSAYSNVQEDISSVKTTTSTISEFFNNLFNKE